MRRLFERVSRGEEQTREEKRREEREGMNLTCGGGKKEDEKDLPGGFRGETIKWKAVKKTLEVSIFEHRDGDLRD